MPSMAAMASQGFPEAPLRAAPEPLQSSPGIALGDDDGDDRDDGDDGQDADKRRGLQRTPHADASFAIPMICFPQRQMFGVLRRRHCKNVWE